MLVAPNFDPIFWKLGRLAGAAVMSVARMRGMVGVPSALAQVDAKLAARNECSRKFGKPKKEFFSFSAKRFSAKNRKIGNSKNLNKMIILVLRMIRMIILVASELLG